MRIRNGESESAEAVTSARSRSAGPSAAREGGAAQLSGRYDGASW